MPEMTLEASLYLDLARMRQLSFVVWSRPSFAELSGLNHGVLQPQ
jgi:hypothetical protein